MDPEKNLGEKRTPTIRTMRTDAELYAKEKKLSTMQISAAAYASQRPPIILSTEKESSRNKLFFVGGIVFVLAIALGGGVWYFLSSSDETPAAKELVPPASIVITEGQNTLALKEINTMTLVNAISEEFVKTFRSGILTYYPIKVGGETTSARFINAKEFFQLLGWHTPDTLLNILDSSFNLFIFAVQDANHLVLITKVSNFERAFSSMLEWERTLARDWQNMLSDKGNTVAFPSAFQDEIIKNHDARILKQDSGSMIIGYTIFNKKYIIISSSRDALGTVLERLIALPPRQ